jgi:hypothetical protein
MQVEVLPAIAAGNLPTADQPSYHGVTAAQAVTLAEGQTVNGAVENVRVIDGAQGFVRAF